PSFSSSTGRIWPHVSAYGCTSATGAHLRFFAPLQSLGAPPSWRRVPITKTPAGCRRSQGSRKISDAHRHSAPQKSSRKVHGGMLKLVGMVVETNHLRLLPGLALALALSTRAAPPDVASQPANTWVKQTPLPATPVSPRLGYEGACVWDSTHRVVIRYGGHNQGGGGEQGSEVWACDPIGWKW